MKLGIDIGGTHICIGVVEGSKLVIKEEINTNEVNVLEYVINKSNTFLQKYPIEMVGVGYCGSINNGIIEQSPNLNIEKCNIQRILQEALKVPVIVRNDAKCAGLAEKKYGAMKEYEDCVLLTIGTGVGGAYFYKGRLVEPQLGSAFEIGHMQIEKNGIQCKCRQKRLFRTIYVNYSIKKRCKKSIEYRKRYNRERVEANNRIC